MKAPKIPPADLDKYGTEFPIRIVKQKQPEDSAPFGVEDSSK